MNRRRRVAAARTTSARRVPARRGVRLSEEQRDAISVQHGDQPRLPEHADGGEREAHGLRPVADDALLIRPVATPSDDVRRLLHGERLLDPVRLARGDRQLALGARDIRAQ